MRQLPGLGIGDVICLLDIDNFKDINTQQGHVGGDLVLRRLGVLIRANIRGADTAGRYGGDEVIIMLRGASETVAVDRLGLLQQLGEGRVVAGHVLRRRRVVDDSGWQVALSHADAAMYRAKHDGRNRSIWVTAEVARDLADHTDC